VDIIFTVDSDTYWDESTLNLLKPFTDKTVGAASGRQTIFNASDNWVRRIAEWMEDLRFRIILPFQSYFGQVNVIPGRTLAIRAKLFKEIVAETRDERVLGRRIITSDDASITMGVLERGYKTVYQSNSLVHTDAPNTFIRFWRQYLRWYRGAMRRFFYKFPVLIRQNPLVFLSSVEFIFGSFLYAAILATFIFKLNFRLYEIVPITGFKFTESLNLQFVLLLIIGYLVSSYIRQLPHLIHHKRDALFLPIFSIFTFVMMLPLKLTALFSYFENGWMTRKQHSMPTREQRVAFTRTVAAATGLVVLLIALPLPYLADMRNADVPFSVVVNKEAPEYYKARQIITSYEGGSQHESVGNIDHLVTNYSIRHKIDLDAKQTAAAATCAQKKLSSEENAIDKTKPLDPFVACINDRAASHVAAASTSKEVAAATTAEGKTATLGEVAVKVQAGDSQTKLVRNQIRQLDEGHKLSAAQVVYIETSYIQQTGQKDVINPGDTLTIDQSSLSTFLEQGKQLSTNQLANWQVYASHIIY
jgi:hypothetical protein